MFYGDDAYNGAEIGVFEQADKVCLNGFLESTDSRRLEAEVGLEVLGNFTNETLEGKLSDQELSRLLVTTDLTESNSSRLVSVGFLLAGVSSVQTLQVC